MARRLPLIASLFLALWLPTVSAGVRAPCSACKAVTVHRPHSVGFVCELRSLFLRGRPLHSLLRATVEHCLSSVCSAHGLKTLVPCRESFRSASMLRGQNRATIWTCGIAWTPMATGECMPSRVTSRTLACN